mgnify:CR=1 FL=1
MELVSPAFGLVFWMTLTFLVFLFILKKFVWPPILKSLKSREEFIEWSLKSAEEAKAEMSQMKADNEKLLAAARLEREEILKEAKAMKEKILSDAKLAANEEGDRLIFSARAEIDKEKNQALKDIKKHVAELSLEIAEKVIKKELGDKTSQEALVNDHLNQTNAN